MKRGFTLVELLATVIILGVISLICFPVLKSAFSASSQSLLDKQIDSIENIARSWGTTNINKVDKCYILTLEELKKSGLLENKDIVNPKTKKELNGCIKINFDEGINQYTYNYTEADLCDCLGS